MLITQKTAYIKIGGYFIVSLFIYLLATYLYHNNAPLTNNTSCMQYHMLIASRFLEFLFYISLFSIVLADEQTNSSVWTNYGYDKNELNLNII